MRKKQTNKQTKSTNQTTVVWAKICRKEVQLIDLQKNTLYSRKYFYIHHILTEQINRRMYN